MATRAGARQRPGAAAFVPATRDPAKLARAATGCQGCELFQNATQVVFGDGPRTARMLLIGEQPGDVEDRAGLPFVGPAGKLLRTALDSAGIDVEQVYLTNAVKHFRWKATGSGRRRLHDKPGQAHVLACRPWLLAELAAIQPRVVVTLGATAAHSLLGTGFALTRSRGIPLDWPAELADLRDSQLFATIHPSAVLRAAAGSRADSLAGLVADLTAAHRAA